MGRYRQATLSQSGRKPNVIQCASNVPVNDADKLALQSESIARVKRSTPLDFRVIYSLVFFINGEDLQVQRYGRGRQSQRMAITNRSIS